MQQVFLQQNHSSKLNLIFLGYGQDVAHFEYLKDKTDNDIALVFDYQNHNFDASVYTEYQEINLITWSMGVMVAPVVLVNTSLVDKLISKVAINGTVEGIDLKFGIPKKIWELTISSMNETNALKFNQRMCNDETLFNEYTSIKSNRTVENLKSELQFILDFSQDLKTKEIQKALHFNYDLAILGLQDKIFSLKNMLASMVQHHVATKTMDIAHYNKEVFIELLK